MDSQQARFYDLIEDFSNAMLISQDSDDLHARPMAVAGIEPETNKLWFATSRHTEKVDEVITNPKVNVAFQGKMSFASIQGKATLNTDQHKINELWQESWRTWFPRGKDSKEIVLIEVEAEHGEFWDMSGKEGLSMVIDTAAAYLTGETPAKDKKRHDTVPLSDDDSEEFKAFAK